MVPYPAFPSTPGATIPGTTPPGTTPPGTTPPGTTATTPPSTGGGLGDETEGGRGPAFGGGQVATASQYIDSAIPQNMVRFRFDSEYDINRPDRGDFWWPKCGCFAPATGTRAPGPPLPETDIKSAQEYSVYMEYAPCKTFSGFLEIPFRAINPEVNDKTYGLSDINFGMKYAFWTSEDTVATAQLRIFVPSGDGFRGLGNEHTTVEPAFLLYQRLADRWFLEAELRDWIPMGGTDFESNVLRYGAGVSYLLVNEQRFRIQPVVEIVGWTFLGGNELDPDTGAAVSANGNTIVNAKVGVRFGFGCVTGPWGLSPADFGVSYGRALTGDFIYKDIVRAELRLRY
jgi:hypothetical protein